MRVCLSGAARTKPRIGPRKDDKDAREIQRVFDASRGRYGARKVWHQLRREGYDIARCTVERLMKVMGLQGVTRGKKKTTIPDPAQACPEDKVNRAFTATAPNQLWVSGLHLCVDLGGNGLRGLCH